MLAQIILGTHHLMAWMLIGLIAGALAGRVVGGRGFGLAGDIVVGLVGALVGGFLLVALFGAGQGPRSFIGETIVAFAGAAILLFLLRLVTRGRTSSTTANDGSSW
jgi:uncharacterized membrane protein YeaQ/YmgE (transglycosylase-associated protein family)